jgi:hypothetical protein
MLSLYNMASEADVDDVTNDPLLSRLRGAKDESNILLYVEYSILYREIAVSAMFHHKIPQRGLYLITDLVEFIHVLKGHEVVS